MPIEEFPKIKVGQTALLRAENNTGFVLDEECEKAVNSSQNVYTIFENTEDAILFARVIVSGKENTECVIYNHIQEPLFFITTQNIDSFK